MFLTTEILKDFWTFPSKRGRAVISLGVDRRGCILVKSSASALHILA
jgi:hypothetical protein